MLRRIKRGKRRNAKPRFAGERVAVPQASPPASSWGVSPRVGPGGETPPELAGGTPAVPASGQCPEARLERGPRSRRREEADRADHPPLRLVTSAAPESVRRACLSAACRLRVRTARGALRTGAPYQRPTAMPSRRNLPPEHSADAGGGKFFHSRAGERRGSRSSPAISARHTRC